MLIRHRKTCSGKQQTRPVAIQQPVNKVINKDSFEQLIEQNKQLIQQNQLLLQQFLLNQQQTTTIINELGFLKGYLSSTNKKEPRRSQVAATTENLENNTTFNPPPPTNSLLKPDRTYQDSVELIQKIKNVRSVQDVLDIIVELCIDTYLNKDHPENHCVRFHKGKTYMYNPYKKTWPLIDPKEATRILFEETTTTLFCIKDDDIETLSCEAEDVFENCEQLYDSDGTSIHKVCKREILAKMLEMESDSKHAVVT
jgi:hypothetical protein